MDDDKMVETAMRTAFTRQHGIELPAWINDHKKPYPQPTGIEDVEPITLWDMAKVALKVMAAAFIIGLIGAAWA